MKYQETFIGSKTDLTSFIKKMVPDLFGDRLEVQGQNINIPSDLDLEYKLKYDYDEDGKAFVFKVSWNNQKG